MSYRLDKIISDRNPEIVFIENTPICNLRCITCPLGEKKRENGMMTFLQFKNIADQVKIFGQGTRINFYVFGEPFIHPEAIQEIAYAKNINLPLEISTNVVLLDEGKICTLLAILNHDDCLILSMDAMGKEEYEKTRIGGQYEKLMQNFHWIVREHARKISKPRLILQLVYNWFPDSPGGGYKGIGYSDGDSQLVYNFIQNITPEVWKANGKNFCQQDIDDLVRNYERKYSCGDRIVNLTEKVMLHVKPVDDWSGRMGTRKGRQGENIKHCDFPWNVMIVLWNGDVTVCCKDYDGEINVGNAFQNTLQEIWNGEGMQQLRKDFLFLRKDGICKNC
jgi:MoaA/NifB/PqqE/SkfB family radical SAM enzyme